MATNRSLLAFYCTIMVWSFGLELIRPIRKYVMKRSYFRRFRRMLKENSNLSEKDKVDSTLPTCPSCRCPFDKGKKRRLIDTCGHTRCYTCIFSTDHCPLCHPQAHPKIQQVRRPNSYFFPRQLPVQPRPNSISIESPQHLAELGKQDYLQYRSPSCFIIPKENRRQSAHEISQVEVHQHMEFEMIENAPLHKRSTVPKGSMGKRISQKLGTFERNGNLAPLNSVNTGSLVSMSSQRDLISVSSRQNLRSREQSVSSLMSISSRSSSMATDFPKHIGEKEEGIRMRSQRSSFAQSSSDSLDNSVELHGNLPAVPEKSMAVTLRLKPLYFEVPQPEPDHPFIGRHWLLKEIEKMLQTNEENYRGIAVIGGPGTGKTSLILQLVDYSSFGRKWEETLSQTTQDIYCKIKDLTQNTDGDQMSVSSRGSLPKCNNPGAKDSVLHQAAARVVGYHFCQKDYNVTCMVPDFVHSLAAQLCQAPQLRDYRDLLSKEPRYQSFLCLDSCLADPDKAFVKGILEPLNLLTLPGPVESHTALLVVDSLHEAEECKANEKTTIASFLTKHLPLFPRWLKVVVTARSDYQNLVSPMQLNTISFDMYSNDFVQQDLFNYIHYRISNSAPLQNNVRVGRKVEEECNVIRFSEHLASISRGSFLYAKLTLDLMQRGHLVIKSTSFSVLPMHLSEVFLLMFNLNFPSSNAFEKVSPILEICLASLYPLTMLEAFHSLNSRYKTPKLTWFEFLQLVETLRMSHILVHRLDGSLMISYPSLREWLTREACDTSKFTCDICRGHGYLALRMARLESPLSPVQGLEFSEHLLKANVFTTTSKPSHTDMHFLKNMQALWLQHCMLDTTASLAHERNIFAPSINVSRLMLQAGANPNAKIGIRNEIPIMNLAAEKGHTEFLFLLMEFGADCNIQNLDDGITPLMAASRKGHETIVQILLAAGAKVHVKDAEGKTALCYAAEKADIDIVKLLIKSQWPDQFTLNAAINTAFVAAAGKGHLEVCEHLIKETDVQVNSCDPLSGHTALTFASWKGHTLICRLLLENGATTIAPSRTGAPPIIWAVRGGHTEVVQLFLHHQGSTTQIDKEGKTPLMWAAAGNRIEIMKLLLQKDVPIDAKDYEGFTALAWAAEKNCTEASQCLLDRKANIECLNIKGRTPLSLAVKHKDGEMVSLLLKHGANMEHKDYCGNTPLEEAINEGSITAVSKLLHQGVKLGPKIWCSAQKQPNMLLVLMHKLLSDGVVLYKKEKLQESKQRFQYALNKFPSQEVQGEKAIKFKQLQFYLHLGLSRSHRKLKEFDLAIKSADQALELRTDSYEALYVRAKAKHEAGQYQDALHDVTRAIHVAHSDTRVIQTLQNLRADILTSSKIVCPLDGVDPEGSRNVTHDRRRSSVSSHERQHILSVQPCRPIFERQH